MRLRSGEREEFSSISGIATDDRYVYVADQDNTAVQVFDGVGRFVRGWGEHEHGKANVSLPHGIAIAGLGRVVLIDTLRQEVKMFEPDGQFLGIWGGLGRKPGEVSYPTDVCTDAAGRVWVADTGNARVQALTVVEAEPVLEAVPDHANTTADQAAMEAPQP
jgi:tripartite motif-containing protein 71